MNLLKILESIAIAIQAIKEFLRLQKIKGLKDAKEEALETKDQRKFEEKIGGSSGPASDEKYPGMFTRERKKK